MVDLGMDGLDAMMAELAAGDSEPGTARLRTLARDCILRGHCTPAPILSCWCSHIARRMRARARETARARPAAPKPAAPKPAPKPVAPVAPAAAPKPKAPARKAPTVIDGFDAAGTLVLDERAEELPPRAAEFVERLKTFQMRVADPCTKERVNRRLAHCSADYRATTGYYEDRPQLATYTISTEISRMKYAVVPPDGGKQVTELDGIRALFAECCPAGADGGNAAAAAEPGGEAGTGGAGVRPSNAELVWRLANQSLLAGLMQELQGTFGTPEDVELCISIHNTASSFVIDLHACAVTATTEFKVATVGVADEAMLPLASMTGEIFVDLENQLIKQHVRDIRLLMVFDDDLEAAARSLAEAEARGGVFESPAKGASLASLR